MQPDVVELRYFKIWIILYKISLFWNIKGLHDQVAEIKQTKNKSLNQVFSPFVNKLSIYDKNVLNQKFCVPIIDLYNLNYGLI